MASQQARCGEFQDLTGHQGDTGTLRLYDRAMAATSCGIVISDASLPNNPIIYCNPAFEKITGYSTAEVLGRNCRFLQGKDTDPAAIEQIRQAVRKGKECQVVLKNYRKDGTPFWNDLSISPVYDDEGRVTQFIGVQTDITERKAAQEAQCEGETRLRLALGAASMGVWDWDLGTNRVTWSEEVEGIFGLAPGSFTGTYEAYLQCIHPEDCYRVGLEIASIVEVGKDLKMEYRVIRPDGIGWVASRGAVVRDNTGKCVRMMGTVMDITERKQAEEASRQQFLRERLVGAIAKRIRQSLDLEEVLNTTVAEVRHFLSTDRVLIYRFDLDRNGVVVVESVGEDWTPILGTSIQDPCFGKSYVSPYQQGRVRAIDNIYTAGIQQCHIDLLAQFQVRANLVVPILQGENLWGLLIAHHCREPRKWQESEVELLKQLSVQLAIAIKQSVLFQQLNAELVERKQAEIAWLKSEAQLKEQTTQLKRTLGELGQTQSQLIQSEKMSSLGQLVAGVAHEINNPVSFIYGNLDHANQYAHDLLNLLNLYQKHFPKPPTEIQVANQDIDLDFLVEDFPKLLTSMKMGADRIRDLVLSLRNFSRLDESQKKAVDIHEGIDNTLLILQHRLKEDSSHPKIQIIKEYGDLPKVDCYAGQLNQVFMNLLSNAIDALEEYNAQQVSAGGASLTPEDLKANPSQITIRTSLKDEGIRIKDEFNANPHPTLREGQSPTSLSPNPASVVIRIADNGPGIPEAIQKQIFDPFFTTKAVGKGTGLGLSISYQVVVERHGGQLECVSTPGKGTEFIIEIPIQKVEEESLLGAHCPIPLSIQPHRVA
ncbi:PAS domain-containing protein [Coleofasciculus sp. FACHB-129]|uniref:PAS domain-containing sensor histidine kinase n=1 Tax=Cyanophyceae TaxID=3028117 RepID=UPI001F5537EB|nr:PAS domain-containing protein [Coleofasciculus sp. FACHB-129]